MNNCIAAINWHAVTLPQCEQLVERSHWVFPEAPGLLAKVFTEVEVYGLPYEAFTTDILLYR